MVDIEPTAVFFDICRICKYFRKFIVLELMMSKKEEEKSNKVEHSHIFEKDVMLGQLYWFCLWAQS